MNNPRSRRRLVFMSSIIGIAIASTAATFIGSTGYAQRAEGEPARARNVQRARRVASDLASPLYTNASSQDSGSHEINEVSMIVTPTYSSLVRNFVSMAWCAYMRYEPGGSTFKINVAVGIPGSSFGLLPPPTPNKSNGFAFMNLGDPVLASNPGTTGYNPRRIYLAGTAFEGIEDQITVWSLLPGFVSQWTAPFAIAHNSNGQFEDKPAIAVSQSDPTRGHVYLAYIASGSGSPTIEFYRNTLNDSWQYVGPAYASPGGETLQGTRLDVDPSGAIYLSYLDWANNRINVRVSYNEGNSWSQVFSDSTGTLLTNDTGTTCNGGCVSASSVLSSSFNTGSNSLALVYHRRRDAGVEVVMRRFIPPSGLFTAPVRVSGLNPEDLSKNDQWHGAVACGTDGSCVVSYYNNLHTDDGMKYRVYDRRVNADGNGIPGEPDVVLWDALSDPHAFRGSGQMEYHDAFFRNNLWYSASVIVNPNYTSDVLVTSQ